ncbi:Cu(I)-responsive transcriptional regulator [Cupriavidus sp. TMH.W2]|uniref:Cu(I)-responsive transcriptional regulator n=1 Tax=Cupriavidus sp. TMH.W2 TaxID=3434465 RepID=UPI003D77CB78
MNIGEAAQASGVSAKMIRHYEAIGLVSAPPRTEGGYRRYDERAVHNLRFVRRARNLGFSLDEIRNLLSLWHDRGRASADVKALTLRHVAELEQRIAELAAMRDTLRELAQHCNGDDRPDCPILADIAQPEEQGRPACHS